MLLYTFSILFRKDEEERESLIINVCSCNYLRNDDEMIACNGSLIYIRKRQGAQRCIFHARETRRGLKRNCTTQVVSINETDRKSK